MAKTTKITQLTPGQERRLGEVYEEWLTVGRSCEPLDCESAEAIITEFYARIGKPAPRVLFFSSPAMCVLAYGALRGMPELWGQLRGQLGGQLSNYFGGQHWCAWEVFYAFCGEIGVRYTADQSALLDLWLRQSRGFERFLLEANAKVLDSSVQPMHHGQPETINELLSINLPGDPDGVIRAVKVIDPSTGRVYVLRVPPEMQRVQQAIAWTFDVPEHEYVLAQES